MEIKDFIVIFADQFEDTDADVFTPETEFHEMEEWSSMMALSVMSMIEDEYEVTVNAEELRNVKNIQELFNLVESKK